MALPATLYRLKVALSDADRGRYVTHELRVSRHPSEAVGFLVGRVLAYALFLEEGLAFSRGGLSSTEDPALAVRDPDGRLLLWIDIGTPPPERLARAARKAARVVVVAHKDPAPLLIALEKEPRAEAVEVWALTPALVAGIAARLEEQGRSASLEVVRSGGALYVTVAGATLEGELQRVKPLA